MAPRRKDILKKFNDMVAKGVPIIGSGAGAGISAKFEEKGGSDLIIIYNSGRYRMAGRVSITGLFAYGDANAIVMDMAREILPLVQKTPVLAGVNGTDPFRSIPFFLKQVKDIGFAGVQNFPTMGLFDGTMRENAEACGLGYDKEVEMIREANKLDLLTTPYVFTPDEAREMVKAGADIIVPHAGLTTGGSIGAGKALTMDQAIDLVLTLAEAGRSVRKDVLVICHGGPFDEPEAVADALKKMPGISGFYGASSAERLPVERAITDQIQRFKKMKIAPYKAGGARKAK